jgi:hypothetical protein
MPSLALQPAWVPSDAAFPPSSAQALVNFVAAYLAVYGLENLEGVLVQEAEPAAADRGKAWVKLDPSNQRPLGLYVFYSGAWGSIPFIIPSGEQEPGAPKLGELFYNTELEALRMFNGTTWTTNLWPSGATGDRPDDVPSGYLFFDEDLGKLLRYTSQGWSTFEGGVGDIKMVDVADESTALQKNPGWSVFAAIAGRFPVGSSGAVPPQSEGGATLDEMKIDWAAQGRSASGGSREATASFIAELTINGTAARADGQKLDALSALGATKTVNLKPPYRALIFLRKDF